MHNSTSFTVCATAGSWPVHPGVPATAGAPPLMSSDKVRYFLESVEWIEYDSSFAATLEIWLDCCNIFVSFNKLLATF